ncbi:protocadherin-16 [Esox lucius]|uniref:Protocadherin-16 n=1 Tax=Esox lucius TaxID=8010 RepID=A0A3P8ZSD8_ESOLU|nr:protocadherin-16 [Esox lucius]
MTITCSGRPRPSGPCLSSGLWRRPSILLLCVVLVLVAVHPTAVLGALELRLDEEQPAGTIVGDISAGLPPGVTASLYFISDHEGTGVGSDLHIDETSGIITTARRLDRERKDHYSFIAVTMTGVTIEVSVTVDDINDHAPVFPKPKLSLKIPEQTAVGTRFSLDPASDADRDQLTTQGYVIKEGNIGQAFRLETKRGANKVLYLDLVVNGVLDREKRSSYSLILEAFDGGSPRRTGLMTLDVSVTDINDHAPVFNQSRYHAIISESLPQGSNILQVFASDADEGDNGLVLYEINRRQSDPDRYFVMDMKSGIITLNRPLDYELKRVHELVVQARDNASQPEVTNAFVTIHVRDYNDNQPTMTIIFLSEDGSPRISEGAQPGQYVARISVTDPDYGEYANVNVSLEGGDGKFALTTKDSIIYLICVDQVLDREERDSYQLRVMATDAGTPPLRAESSFTIQVTDVNDNPPLFDQQAYRQTIPEVVYPGSFVLQVTARDKDQGPNGDVRYSLLTDRKTHSDWFSIDPVTGIITTAKELDYELEPAPSVTVVATDNGRPPLSSTARVDVVLQDVNDNKPVFSSDFYNVTIKENLAAGTCFLEVTATDADRGSFGAVSYSLGSGSGSRLAAPVPTQFTVNKETGQLCTSATLDRDQGSDTYNLTVTATDGGGQSVAARVRVTLEDINDNPPSFYPLLYTVSLSTHSPPGTSVAKVTAKDPDAGDNGKVTYRTVSGGGSAFFTLNKDTGVISLSRSLHGKANTLVSLVISAQDGGGLTAPANARVNVSVVGGSVSPPLFDQAQYYFTVSEEVLRGTEVGKVHATVKTGLSQEIFYSISSGDPDGYFTVDSTSGALRTSLPLDHEARPSLELVVQARYGSPPAYGTTRVHIAVSDVNDNAPSFLPSSSESLLLPEVTKMGSVVYRVQATDRDSGPNGQLSFDLVSTGPGGSGSQRMFGVDRGNGELRLIGVLNYESVPRYDLQVIAKDGGAPQLSSTFTLVVHVQAQDAQGPAFDTLTYRVELRENTPMNTRFLQVRALNREAAGNGAGSSSSVTYRLRPDGDAAGFGVAPDSGWLFVRSSLDREAKDMYLLTVLASSGPGDQGVAGVGRTGSATVRVSVTDENDNSPRLSPERVFLAVRENLPVGTGFGRVSATDRDAGLNARLTYRLLHSDRHFQINSHTGEISTRLGLDRERQSSYQLVVVVQDGGTPPRSATGTAHITVLDENDNAPVFSHTHPEKELLIQVMEGSQPGSVLGIVTAKDPDEGENGTIYYSLSGPRVDRFSVNPATGELRSSSPLRHSDRAEYSLTVTASDHGTPPHTSTCLLRIQVLSSSKTSAKNTLSMTLNSVEGAIPGSVIGSVRSHDHRDPLLLDSQVTYVVVGGTDRQGTFMVDRLTGDVYLVRELDYEEGDRYTLHVEVSDFTRAFPSSHRVQLDINVQDRNDHAPQFSEDPVTIVIPENTLPGASIYTFQADDKDGSGPNSAVRYSIEHRWPDSPSLLTLDPSTGVLTLGQSLDHEATASLVLVVRATDQAEDPLSRRWGSVTAQVFVTDVNDNAPVFSSPSAVSVMEDQPVGFVVVYVMARDEDEGENGRVTYRVQSGNSAGSFSLNPNTGSLSILKALDRENQEVFNLTLVAEDHGMPALSTSQVLSIQVIDVNDERPLFQGEELVAEVRENQVAGTTVVTVTATDRDQGSNGQVTYGGLTEDGFTINAMTGVITTTKSLDRETQDHYTLTVYARDGGVPPNFATVVVRVSVRDENDNAPVFARPWHTLEVPENQIPMDLCVLRATDTDMGPSGTIDYRISAGDPNGDFQLHSSSGVLSISHPLDRELQPGYTLEVVALDRGSPALSSTATVEVTVLDVNDNSPVFGSKSYTVDVSEDAAQGTPVLKVTAIDADEGENGQVLYFLSREARGAFTIDENTGHITTAAPLDREKTASYNFHVFAVDLSPAEPRNTSAQVTVTILDVNDNAPFFIQDPLVVEVSASQSQRVLATMRAEDKDFGANGSVFYRFAAPVRGFSINSLTGEIQGTEGLGGLSQAQRMLIVEAMDQGTPTQSSMGVVVVYVKEQEYTGIRFPRNARDVSIQENAAKGTAVAQTKAQFPNGTQKGIRYSLFSGNRQQAFSISTTTGEISVQSSLGLDFEDTPRLRLVVKAETAGSTSFMAVNLILQDVNDNLPRFQLQNYIAYMREAQGYDRPIIQVVAEDVDQGQNGQVTYSIQSSGGMSGLFKIDPVTGSISTAAIMDREIWKQTRLVVTATDRGSPRLAGSATLTVIIVDLNDNSPTIPLPTEVRIPENTLIGTEITLVTGNDVDSSPALSYSLQLGGSAQGTFGIHRYSGGLSLTGPLDYEDRTWYMVTVRTTDSQHQAEANITVLVEDVNDNAPVFTQDLYQVTLPEHGPPGSPVVTVTATDRDSGDNGKVTYRVQSSTREGFYVDPSNGTLFINERAEFDPENPSVSVVVEARDGGSPPLFSLTTVQVHLSDVNDNAPVFHQSEYRATVSEDSFPGVTILTLEAVDADLSRDNRGLDFAIASGNTGNIFQIESSVRFQEGRGFQTVGMLLLAESLDFEATPLYNLTVVVSDRGVPQRSSSVAAVITVGDVNDSPPAFSRGEYTVSLSEGAAAGTEILRLTATDPDTAPNAEVQYSISSGDEMNLFSVDQWTGALRLQRSLDREHRSSHVVIVQASDGLGHFALAPISVEVKDVNDNIPFFPIKTLTASIRENQPVNSVVTILHAIDHDTGMYGQLRYHMADRGQGVKGREAFTVDPSSGELRTKMIFDFEKVNTFSFVALAVDVGNHSASVTVQVYVTGEDEYDPLFVSPQFSFEVPEGAKKGQSIGQVQANDEDGGVDGIILYSLPNTSPYFDVNKTTGVVFLKMDGSSSRSSGSGGRSKRETRTMTLEVQAHSPLDTSRVTTAQLNIDVTNTSFGLGADLDVLMIIVIAVSLGVVVLLVVMAVVIFLVKSKRRRTKKERENSTITSGTALQTVDESGGSSRIYHQTLPGYAGDQCGAGGGPYTRGGSLDPSHSSGRGSAEAAEDDEIRMINEYPRVASISSSMQEHISARGPDSGIQQDADQLSDVSCEPAALEGSTWFKGKKLGGSLSGTLLSGQLPVYRDELGGGYLGVGRGLNISHPKDYAFPEDGKPSVDGSLTAIVASDEELRGSYNWDYLLNWCPQFQPLANVFTEIARLKDETAPQNEVNPRRPFQPKAKTDPKPRIDPPPLITSVAHPGAMSVPPKVPVIGRTFPHLAALRRSPISHEGSISSAAMSPSFSPSLSPLAARSPAVSPFGVTQGPSASMISTREPSLDHSPDHEMRI